MTKKEMFISSFDCKGSKPEISTASFSGARRLREGSVFGITWNLGHSWISRNCKAESPSFGMKAEGNELLRIPSTTIAYVLSGMYGSVGQLGVGNAILIIVQFCVAGIIQMAYGLFRLSAGLCRTFTISGTDGAPLDQLVFMLGGFTIDPSSLAGSLAAVFQGIDANKHCNWCHDINCVPSSFWSCNEKVLPCEVWIYVGNIG
ncbi:hypothetical protein Sjap_008600 [Stephania japonica]|uniref:Uncharacterized protein n=1 Tax=Stephania japonica TaxID=461633 RepID=A0AAP0JPU1_9MAGN